MVKTLSKKGFALQYPNGKFVGKSHPDFGYFETDDPQQVLIDSKERHQNLIECAWGKDNPKGFTIVPVTLGLKIG